MIVPRRIGRKSKESGEACEKRQICGEILRTSRLGLFFTLFAVEFKSNARRAADFGEHPIAGGQWRIMAYMLKVPAIEFGTPVTLVVSFKANDSTFHHFFIVSNTRSW